MPGICLGWIEEWGRRQEAQHNRLLKSLLGAIKLGWKHGLLEGQKGIQLFLLHEKQRKLSLLTLSILQHKSPSGLISTARAPSSDSLTPLRDVDLNIHMSNGRTHTVGCLAGVSTTELVCSISYLSASDCDLQGYKNRGMQNLELHIGSSIQWVSLDMLQIFVQQARTKARSIASRGNLPFGGGYLPRLPRGNKCLPCDSLLIPMQLGVSLQTSCIKEIQRNVSKVFHFSVIVARSYTNYRTE